MLRRDRVVPRATDGDLALVNRHSRILLYSQRALFGNFHYRLGLYEFEDIIREVDSVDVLTPTPKPWFRYGERLAMRFARGGNIGINPGISRMKICQDYDMFFVVVQFPRDLMQLKYIKHWKERCKTSVCWLNEIWVPDIEHSQYYLNLLSQFDHVVLQWAGSIKPVSETIGKECVYLPYGIDTTLFAPYPQPQRTIDVYSIGRRSEDTHRALLRLAWDNRIFYVFDTIVGDRVIDRHAHRLLVSSLTKRSRYFLVNPGKADNPGETGGQIEFGNRFFEGAASGTIMVGETPNTEYFRKAFDWKDAVVHLPFGSEDIAALIEELDKDPQRQETIRRNNVVQSLRRHDWVYRWAEILRIAGLRPLPELEQRRTRLANLAIAVEHEPTPDQPASTAARRCQSE